MKKMLTLFSLLLLNALADSNTTIPERRGAQFLNEQGYLVIPAPYSLPGIGEGVSYFSSFNNYLGNTDIFAMKIDGDVGGTMLGLWDIFLIDKRLFIDLTYHDFDKAAITNYSARGLDTAADDYSILETDQLRSSSLKATLSFFERRLELIGKYSKEESRLTAIKNPDGTLIQNLSNVEPTQNTHRSFIATLDLTDDRQNPIRGIRTEIQYQKSDARSDFDPDYFTMHYNITGYIPINGKSTLALNAFRSDAVVTRTGELDKTLIAQELGFDCSSGCSDTIQSVIDNRYQQNLLGTAQGMGGSTRLRSYPGNRFLGAHAEAVGIEYRWNLAAERKPFNLYFMKDIRTGMQFAFFHEIATVADDRKDLWRSTRSSSGIGARFIMGSGVVYRFDFAAGDEGSEISIIVDYPWETTFQ